MIPSTSSLRRPLGRRLRLVILLGVVAALVVGCGGAALTAGGRNPGVPLPAASAGGAEPGAMDGIADQGTVAGPAGNGSGTSGSNPANQTYDVSRPDLLIIKIGSLSLQVPVLDDALATAAAKIAAFGGYVSGSDRSGDGDQATATVTYRVPAAQWDAALVSLRGIADKVLAEQTQTQDVTGDVIDLGARITNLRATEAALQAIMAKATKISDVLAVQQQLTDVRGQIEQLTTQKQHLQDQAAFSTLTVTYSLKPQAAVLTSQQQFNPNSEIDRATASLIQVLQALATAGIWFVIVWLPVLAAVAVLAAIAFLIVRRVRRPATPSSILPGPPAPVAGA